MKNIAIVTTWMHRGAAMVSRQYAVFFRENGFNVFIYARGGEEYDKTSRIFNEGFDVHFQKNRNQTWIDDTEFAEFLKEKKIDGILFNEQRDMSIFNKLKNYFLMAYVDYYTNENVSTIFKPYDILFCNTVRHYDTMKLFYKTPVYIPWGTDLSLFKPLTKKKSINAVSFYHDAGFGGGYQDRKGTYQAIRCFPSSKTIRMAVHSQVKLSCGEKANVGFIYGNIDPPNLYGQYDVYLYPSKLEGIGLPICESIACGTPVIVTNNQPMNEFVIDGCTGWKIPVASFKTRNDNYYHQEAIISDTEIVKKIYTARDDMLSEEYSRIMRRNCISMAKEFFDFRKNFKKILGYI